jgi:hypothetical protein
MAIYIRDLLASTSTSIILYSKAILHTLEDSFAELDSQEVIVKLWHSNKRIVLFLTSVVVSSIERKSGLILLLALLGRCDTRI